MLVNLFCIGNSEAKMLKIMEADMKPHCINIKFNISDLLSQTTLSVMVNKCC